MSTNVVVLSGNLTRDAELKSFQESTVLRVGLAVNTGFGKKQSTVFIDIEKWGNSLDNIATMLTKGKRVVVTGELRQDSWEKDGVKHNKLFVRASNLEFASPKTVEKENVPQDTNSGFEGDDAEAPF